SDDGGGRSEGVALSEQDKEAYDEMLSKDERFWTDIDERKARMGAAAKGDASKKSIPGASTFSIVSEQDDIHVEYERKGSWDENCDKDLMDALKAVPAEPADIDVAATTRPTDVMVAAVEFESKQAELDDDRLLEDLNQLNEVATTADGDAFDFADDDFDELEKYLSTLATKE
ncbi:hypothetical protein DYB32_010881, partial [Aphanomyces invadans]